MEIIEGFDFLIYLVIIWQAVKGCLGVVGNMYLIGIEENCKTQKKKKKTKKKTNK